MHKIDSDGATDENEFTDGDPASGIVATAVWAKWLNTVQRELLAILTAGGVTPDDADDGQVLQALRALWPLRCKIIEIGAWNMDQYSNKWVDHGLPDHTKIREVVVMIQADNGELLPGLRQGDGCYIHRITETAIYINKTDGYFNGSFVDDPAINRGWLTLFYEEA